MELSCNQISLHTGWLCLLLCILPLPGSAAEPADAIIHRVEDNLNGRTAVMELTMIIRNSRTTRTMKMKSYSEGSEKSFIKILYPGKDRGITFLKINNSMWQYVPRIEKIIKIPASMMLQSWMGSDFSNDDLVKESSLSQDYSTTLLAETEQEYRLELLPREEAPVVWGKIIMTVSKEYYLPTLVSYFAGDNSLIRELTYSRVQPFGSRFYPTRWQMLPKEPDKVGRSTTVEIANAVFDQKISASYFTKRALKRL
jgi:outer membrane lipoprotein-sorting protein